MYNKPISHSNYNKRRQSLTAKVFPNIEMSNKIKPTKRVCKVRNRESFQNLVRTLKQTKRQDIAINKRHNLYRPTNEIKDCSNKLLKRFYFVIKQQLERYR